MTGEEALVECLIKAKDVRDTSWYEGAFIRVSKDDSSKLIDHNGRTVSLCIFSDHDRVWEIYEPKETCTFAELFEKLGPGDWATRSDCKGGSVSTKHFISQGGILSFWCGSSEMPVMIDRALIESTFIIHRAKQ